jgi:hypothetical protein
MNNIEPVTTRPKHHARRSNLVGIRRYCALYLLTEHRPFLGALPYRSVGLPVDASVYAPDIVSSALMRETKMTTDTSDYGLVTGHHQLAVLHLRRQFLQAESNRDWRTLGLFSAFVVALFTEMYGFPLTIYLLSGWLTEQFPGINWLSHDAGHLPEMLFGWKVNPHFGPFHILSNVFILGGFWLLSKAGRSCTNAAENLRAQTLRTNQASSICSVYPVMFGFRCSGQPSSPSCCSRFLS